MAYRIAVRLVGLLVGAFFRRVEVVGAHHVPQAGGGLVVAWHPNGLVDPALILATFPRRIVFGARHGLLAWPLLGSLMRALGTVPIYRASDAEGGDEASRRERNRESLDALSQAIADGSFSALFPEGVSHDAPHLQELKVGAARLFHRAGQLRAAGAPPPVIVPVGLHYDQKALFRSRVLIEYHPPLALPERLATLPEDAGEDEAKARARELTGEIERALEAAVHPTETWELHHLMHRTRKLLRAERAARAGAALQAPSMHEQALGFRRVWTGYEQKRAQHPEDTAALLARVAEYDADLRALRMEDEELDRAPTLLQRGLPLILLSQVVLVYLLLPPLLMVGYAINGPAYLVIRPIAHRAGKLAKDRASIKVLLGAVLYPLSWLGAATAAAFGQLDLHAHFARMPEAPLSAAFATLVLAIVSGLVALRYMELASETLRALRVRWRRRRKQSAVLYLREERASLHDAILEMAEGLELPGQVAPDGRVSAN